MGCAEPDELEVRIGSRNAERIPVFAPVEVRTGSGNWPVILRDLSTSGARIEAQHSRLNPGEFVRLRLPLLPIEQLGEVVRTAGTSAGIMFCDPLGQMEFRLLARRMSPEVAEGDPSASPELSECEHANVPGPQRPTKRADVAIGAICRTAAGRRGFVAIIHLVEGGCCLFGRDLVLAVGQQISLQRDGRAGLKATVQWSNGPITGVVFDRALHSFMFAHLAATYAWPLSELAKQALKPGGHIAGPVLSELTRLTDRAEIAFHEPNSQRDGGPALAPVAEIPAELQSRSIRKRLPRLFLR